MGELPPQPHFYRDIDSESGGLEANLLLPFQVLCPCHEGPFFLNKLHRGAFQLGEFV